jgi:sulfite exporter TauE/SafE
VDLLVAAPLLAALTGIPHCVGMCGAFACATGGRPAQMVAWHAGRIATYTVLGALAGALGVVVPGPAWVPALFGAVLLLVFSAHLAGVLPAPPVRWPRSVARAAAALARRGTPPARFLFGMLNGLLPCGLVWTALAVPIALADPVWGALSMGLFGLASMPALTAWAWGARRVVGGGVAARRALAVVVLIAGLWSVGTRAGIAGTTEAGALPECHQPSLEHSEQPHG